MNVEIGRQNIIILFWKWRGRTVSFLGIHKSDFCYSMDIYIGFSLALHLQCIASQDAMRLNTGLLAVRRSNNLTRYHINYSLYFQILILTSFSRLVAAVSGSLVISSPFTSLAIRKKTDLFTKTAFIFCGGFVVFRWVQSTIENFKSGRNKKVFFKVRTITITFTILLIYIIPQRAPLPYLNDS